MFVFYDVYFYRFLVFPSTFGMNGYVRIQGMGASLGDVAMEWRAVDSGRGVRSACLYAVQAADSRADKENKTSLFKTRKRSLQKK